MLMKYPPGLPVEMFQSTAKPLNHIPLTRVSGMSLLFFYF